MIYFWFNTLSVMFKKIFLTILFYFSCSTQLYSNRKMVSIFLHSFESNPNEMDFFYFITSITNFTCCTMQIHCLKIGLLYRSFFNLIFFHCMHLWKFSLEIECWKKSIAVLYRNWINLFRKIYNVKSSIQV